MKRTALITATLFAAAFAASSAHAFVGAEESGEVFFTLYDATGSTPDPAPAATEPDSAPAADSQEAQEQRDKELAELREQIYQDMLHE